MSLAIEELINELDKVIDLVIADVTIKGRSSEGI